LVTHIFSLPISTSSASGVSRIIRCIMYDTYLLTYRDVQCSGVATNLIGGGGVYVLTSHCKFKTCLNVPHVNKTVTDFGWYIYRYTPRRYAPGAVGHASTLVHGPAPRRVRAKAGNVRQQTSCKLTPNTDATRIFCGAHINLTKYVTCASGVKMSVALHVSESPSTKVRFSSFPVTLRRSPPNRNT